MSAPPPILELSGTLLRTLPDELSTQPAVARAPSPVAAAATEPACAILCPGTQIARYVLGSRLGAGAMGVVYEAFDPELQRRVALKLMVVGRSGEDTGGGARVRLLREAQALARVSHPNVIAAYDVGTYEGNIFIAMELVEGRTLRDWLLQAKPTHRQILDAFVQAAEGLAAAHRVGLIHRDFKPDNVMIDGDGRVRVLDFGLAREAQVDSQVRHTLLKGRQDGNSDQLRAQLTQTGAIMGTPAYMAPEQHLGELSDARTDQFGFCVALYEALYGERPFAGETYATIALEVLDGHIRPAKKGFGQCPFRKELLRGLSRQRGDRYASMEDLIKRLRHARGQRRRRVAALAAVMGFALAAATGSAVMAQSAPCQSADARLNGVLDGSIRKNVERAFKASGRPHAAETYTRVAKILDEYGKAWVSAHEDVCEATHVAGTQSPALMDRKMYCLDQRLLELSSLTALLAEAPDGALVDRSVRVALELSPLERCLDAGAPPPPSALPDDPTRQSDINAARARIAETEALHAAGQYRRALGQAQSLETRVKTIAFPALSAELALLLGRLSRETGDLVASEAQLRSAATIAAQAQDPFLVPEAWIQLARTVGIDQGRHEEALIILTYAELSVQDDRQRADLFSVRGDLHVAMGRYEEARTAHERALELREKLLGAKHPLVAVSSSSLGEIARQQAHYDVALRYHETAVIRLEEALGPDHPEVAGALDYLAGTCFAVGDLARALPLLERSIGIKERSLGVDHLDLAVTLNILGHVYLTRGDLPQAKLAYRRVLAIREKHLGPTHATLATPYNNLGNVAELEGDLEGARRSFLKALHLKRAAYGAQHPMLVIPLNNLGSTALHQNDSRAARGYFTDSITIGRATLDEDHTHVAYAKAGLGMVYLVENRCDKAVPLLEQALAARLALGEDGVWMAEAKGTLATCLWRRHRKAQSESLHQEGLALLDAAGPSAAAAARTRFEKTWSSRKRR